MVVQTFRNRHLGAFPAVAFPGDCSAPAWLCISIVKVLFTNKFGKDTLECGSIFHIYRIKITADSSLLFRR